MKYSPASIGLFQAAGLTAYVSIFALLVQSVQQITILRNLNLPPVLGITIFLMTFIISALICGSIALLYPTELMLAGNKKEALRIIFWTLGWLVVFFLIMIILAALIFAASMATTP